MPKTNYKKEKAIQHSIYVPKEIDEKISKYKADKNLTYSEVINEALLQFFKIHANKDELTITTDIIEKTIRKELDPAVNRLVKLQVKSSKASYGSLYLVLQMLAFLQNHLKDMYFRNEDDLNFYLKEKIKKADEMSYKAVTSNSINKDIEKLAKGILNLDE